MRPTLSSSLRLRIAKRRLQSRHLCATTNHYGMGRTQRIGREKFRRAKKRRKYNTNLLSHSLTITYLSHYHDIVPFANSCLRLYHKWTNVPRKPESFCLAWNHWSETLEPLAHRVTAMHAYSKNGPWTALDSSSEHQHGTVCIPYWHAHAKFFGPTRCGFQVFVRHTDGHNSSVIGRNYSCWVGRTLSPLTCNCIETVRFTVCCSTSIWTDAGYLSL